MPGFGTGQELSVKLNLQMIADEMDELLWDYSAYPESVRSVQETAENPPDQTTAEETEGVAQVPVSTDQGQRSAP